MLEPIFSQADADKDGRLNLKELKDFVFRRYEHLAKQGIPCSDPRKLSAKYWSNVYTTLNKLNPFDDHIGLQELFIDRDEMEKVSKVVKYYAKVRKAFAQWR